VEPIKLAKKVIEGRESGPHLLVTGGVHGDEFEPMAAVRRLIKQFDRLALRGRLTLVPVVNEAAFEYKHRFADDGLDLARTCPGSADGSVTQRTAHALSKLIRDADFYIDLHTGGTTFSVWPMTGYVLHDDTNILNHQREMAKSFNLPFVWGTYGKLNGRSLSVARDANVPAIYAEYLGGARMDPQGVLDYVDGCLNVMTYLEMVDRKQPHTRIKHIVEDGRENAGHMQIQNPAPIAGFFDPQVRLGQRIAIGEPIGSICDVLGDQLITIRSKQTGVVLMLKTFCRVDQGEAVAVVVEVGRPFGVEL